MERDTALVMNVTGCQGDQLDILVENMGRVNFGSYINDNKVRYTKYNVAQYLLIFHLGIPFRMNKGN